MAASSTSKIGFWPGVLLGILLGGGGVWLMLNGPKKDSPIQQTYRLQPLPQVAVHTPPFNQASVAAETTETETKERSTLVPEKKTGTGTAEMEPDHRIPGKKDNLTDTTPIMALSDNLSEKKATTRLYQPDKVRIRKDMLIKMCDLDLNWIGEASATSDSTVRKAGALHGVKTAGTSTVFQTEFWSSPVNYQGYKIGKNKLMLYGIQTPDSVQLFGNESAYFLLVNKDLFRLQTTDEFRPFQKEKSPFIRQLIEP